MLFSFIVPVYNVKDYLERCVSSIIGQTFANFEVLLIDDGSTDGSGPLCDQLARRDRRIKVIHKANGGLSDARNAGINISNGDYLIFVDSDDYVSASYCETIKEYAIDGYEMIVVDGVCEGGTAHLTHISKKAFTSGSGKDFFLSSIKRNQMPMAAWLYVYKKSFLRENDLLFAKGLLHEDEEFTPRCLLKCKRLVNTCVDSYRYVIRQNSITQKKDLRRNATDLIRTCFSLKDLYLATDRKYRYWFLDSLVAKYLDMFQKAHLVEFGKEYVYRSFVNKYAHRLKTRMKAVLFCISPRFYCFLNALIKNGSNKKNNA